MPTPSAGGGNPQRDNKFKNAIRRFKDLGYSLKVSKNIFICEYGRSASAKERAKELNSMFKDRSINMILCAKGGEFLVEILDYI